MDINSDNTLWQVMDKDALDDQDKLNNDEWQDFINQYSIVFAECASDVARDLFREYLINYKGVKNG